MEVHLRAQNVNLSLPNGITWSSTALLKGFERLQVPLLVATARAIGPQPGRSAVHDDAFYGCSIL